MLTELHAPQPYGYCPLCQAPIYLMKNQFHWACSCLGDFAECASILSTAPERIHHMSTPPNTPQPEVHDAAFDIQDPDSITVEHARKQYRRICDDIKHHQARCRICDELQSACSIPELLGNLDVICKDQREMWEVRLWWSKKLPPSEVMYA